MVNPYLTTGQAGAILAQQYRDEEKASWMATARMASGYLADFGKSFEELKADALVDIQAARVRNEAQERTAARLAAAVREGTQAALTEHAAKAPPAPAPVKSEPVPEFTGGNGKVIYEVSLDELMDIKAARNRIEARAAARDMQAEEDEREVFEAIARQREYSSQPDTPGHSTQEPAPAKAATAPELDLALLATPDQLIEAFGRFTNMNESWFDKWADYPALKEAIKRKGSSGRGRTTEPLFCPFLVMQGLMKKPPRSSSRKAFQTEEKPWELLKRYFPEVYAKHQGLGPLDD